MSNLSNDSTTCYFDQSTLSAAKTFDYVIYRILNSIYLIVGVSSNVVLLFAFYKQSKTEKAYGYQVVFTISKTLETLAFSTYLLAGKWFYPNPTQFLWFWQNYGLVEYFAIGLGLHVSLIITSVLISIAMAADRLFALLKPIVYKNINHAKHQIFASLSCFVLGFLGGGVYFLDVKFKWDDNYYAPWFDRDLDTSIIGMICFYFRLFLRVGGVILLIILNGLMIVVFRRHLSKVANMSSKNEQNEQKRKASERNLLWLNIYQGCCMLINQMPHTLWQVLLFFLPPAFESCQGMFIGSFCDAMIMLTDTTDFFFVILLNKKMRKAVVNGIFGCGGDKNKGNASKSVGGGSTIQQRLSIVAPVSSARNMPNVA